MAGMFWSRHKANLTAEQAFRRQRDLLLIENEQLKGGKVKINAREGRR